MKHKRYEDFEVWKLSIDIAKLTYKITNTSKFDKDRGLQSQIRRAAISISSNIVEGYERNSNNEFIRFLKIAKGSAGELKNQFFLSKELGFISPEIYEDNIDNFEELMIQLGRFLSYLQNKKKNGDFPKPS